MLSNGPHYGAIIEFNRRGQVWYFPMMLTVTVAGYLATAAIAYGIAKWLA